MKLEETERSETSAYKIQTQGELPRRVEQDVVHFNFCDNEIQVWDMWEYFACSFRSVLAETDEHLLGCTSKLPVLPGCHLNYLATL